ncbi:MAG: hypothetical protein QNJ70_20090 [Xenococcaceae cyanobacterium MO_207.B15]|nr:hypothetical protein [Xenococcaceae cyanobacterium MO_207.B15]
MTERYDALFANQPSDYCERVLGLCGFQGKEEYLEHEAEIIRECFGYIESGKSDRVTRYLLRDSQVNAELPVNNDGTLSAAELHELTGATLSEEELNEILDVVDLENKEEYSFQEADSFLESYEAFKSELESQEDDEPEPESEPEPQALTLLDLKQRASAEITLSQVLQLLPLCGLKEQDSYTEEDAVVFERCYQYHQAGRSPHEIAQFFGVAVATSGDPVKQIVENIDNLSASQRQQILETIAGKVVNQQQQIGAAFDQMVYAGLNQAFQNGELKAMIDRKLQENISVGKEVTIQAMVETCLEGKGMLPPQPENPTLPSSSTN